MGKIKPLDKSVINRIAAGEIIIAPANALKEMLENSIDAGATSIDVIVKDGGIKLLQISDNGSGIDKEDLPILCQRFTTSKLKNFEDLNSLNTYGFRGEALASISHIAHLSVTTKTGTSACAWKAFYSDGELVPSKPNDNVDPKPVAGKTGTQITVEDFFYNVPSRLRALKSSSDEFSKILDVIGRYSVHTEGVGFSCKKFGDSHYTLSTRPNLSVKERIRTVFDNQIANELISFEIPGIEKYGLLEVKGQITNPNYNNKKSIQPVFFINNRLVSNDTLKRALFSTVNHFLPKGHRPFIYLSLSIKPSNLDVNIHPTKREVGFLHEDEIIDTICLSVTEQFNRIDSSRSFPTQTLLPMSTKHQIDDELSTLTQLYPSQKKPRLDYNLVRTDASQTKITTFLTHQENNRMTQEGEDMFNEDSETTVVEPYSQIFEFHPKSRSNFNLRSINELREEVESQTSSKLTGVLANVSYIGLVDVKRRLIAVQYDVKLMLFDFASILLEYFYQISLSDFGNFGIIRLDGSDNELSLKTLLEVVYASNSEPMIKRENVLATLSSGREMLLEYFNITIEERDGNYVLTTIPLLLKNYSPPLSKIPLFLYRLGATVNWTNEKECLQGILRQIALLYVPESFESSDSFSDESSEKQDAIRKEKRLNETMERVLLPAMKMNFLAPLHIEKDVIEIANLPGLYKVFERC